LVKFIFGQKIVGFRRFRFQLLNKFDDKNPGVLLVTGVSCIKLLLE
jgi:hypothetical protein